MQPFVSPVAFKVGVLFDGVCGVLTYYKDGLCLGEAFLGLHLIDEPLYPIVSSTAAKVKMSLVVQKREFSSLQDRCRSTILSMVNSLDQLHRLELPNSVQRFLSDGAALMTESIHLTSQRSMSS